MSDVLCATYSVYIRDRRTGLRKVGCDMSEPPVEGQWRRQYKGTSTATIVWSGIDDGCCDCDVVPWEDELVIERNGDDSTLPWVGPVSETVEDRSRGQLTITAEDRSGWWGRRRLFQQPVDVTGVDVVEGWLAVRRDQDRVDSAGLRLANKGNVGTLIDIDVNRYDPVESTLQTLTDVAWTVVGDKLHGPGATTTGEQTFKVLDAAHDWVDSEGLSGPVIQNDGRSTATKVFVRGGNNRIGEWPPAGTKVPANGLHIPDIIEAPTTDDQTTLNQLAKAVYDRNKTGTIFLVSSSGSLRRSSPVAVADLIPGRRFGAEITGSCRDDFMMLMELSRVVVDFGWEVRGGIESVREKRVAVDFAPVGIAFDSDRFSV